MGLVYGLIGQQRKPGRPVRIILDGFNCCFNPAQTTLEINDPVFPFVPTAEMTRSETPTVVAATGPFERFNQRPLWTIFRNIVVSRRLLKPLSRRDRSKSLYCHCHLFP